ncbi:MAG TPA: YceI family protein [Puia sp.]|nr:YceI family protein [Puia sp.]
MAKKILFTIITSLVLSSILQAQTTWTADKNHSQLHFSAVHFGISHIGGVFDKFEVSMKSEKEDFSDAQFEMIADVRSIDTHVEMRDNDLKSPNWFDAEKFPELVFKSTSFTKVKNNHYKLNGTITIHGVSKPIEFDVTFNGEAVTMTKKQTGGFTVTGKLNRSDFNLGRDQMTTGVSNEVDVWADVEIGKN